MGKDDWWNTAVVDMSLEQFEEEMRRGRLERASELLDSEDDEDDEELDTMQEELLDKTELDDQQALWL